MRVAVASGDVACAAGLDAVRDLDAVCLFESLYHVEHGVAVACAEVVNGKAAFAFDGLEGGDVACGEVANVDVVADAGAVRGVVVVTEYAEFLAEADCGLCDVWH